ncbi:peptidoglycan-binding domain-containing protein [Kitasatospora fiedleri]|uniref:peptidoglycan-binding domain-containing protein n=1 Tax=Kitasatospora fiedleri TaxID=2991545 RepID=UPI00249BD48E|nr:peptidoglycan-binding domain-containing protein [Kitasatospora fiedleri]
MTTSQDSRGAAGSDPTEPGGTSSSSPPDRGSATMRRRRRVLAALVAAAVVTGGAGVAAGTVLKSPAQVAAETQAPPADVLTASVEHRVVADTLITRGTVSPAVSVEVGGTGAAAGAARAVVTKVEVEQGQTIRFGSVLFEVSGRPVFALQGKIPAYRDLRAGMTGDDVAQLQKALAAVGYPVAPDGSGTFGSGTERAVESFYRSIGYRPIRAADDKAPGGSTAAGSTGGRVPAGGTGAAGGGVPGAAGAEQESGPVVLPASELVYLAGAPARAGAVAAKVGDAPTDKLMSVSMGALAVRGEVTARQRGMLRPGQQVEILDEGTGAAVAGKVASVADVPTAAKAGAAEAQPGSSTYTVKIAPEQPLAPESAGRDVRLTITSASSSGKVLAVPAAALSTGSDGRVSVGVRAGAGAVRRVEVRVGASGGGFVEVSPVGGGQLTAGARVVVGDAPAASNGGRP